LAFNYVQAAAGLFLAPCTVRVLSLQPLGAYFIILWLAYQRKKKKELTVEMLTKPMKGIELQLDFIKNLAFKRGCHIHSFKRNREITKEINHVNGYLQV
jgi:hypothetical protein